MPNDLVVIAMMISIFLTLSSSTSYSGSNKSNSGFKLFDLNMLHKMFFHATYNPSIISEIRMVLIANLFMKVNYNKQKRRLPFGIGSKVLLLTNAQKLGKQLMP